MGDNLRDDQVHGIAQQGEQDESGYNELVILQQGENVGFVLSFFSAHDLAFWNDKSCKEMQEMQYGQIFFGE